MMTKTKLGDLDVAAGSITADEIGSGEATAGQALMADGEGGVVWGDLLSEGGAEFGALSPVTLIAETVTEIVDADSGRVATVIANNTGATLFCSFTTGDGLSDDASAFQVAPTATLFLGNRYAQAAIYGYSAAGGIVHVQTASS